MAGRVTLWVALAALATFCFAMASRAGRDVLDDQQIPRLDKATEHFMCALWVGLGTLVGGFVFFDVFLFFNPEPPSLNAVPTR